MLLISFITFKTFYQYSLCTVKHTLGLKAIMSTQKSGQWATVNCRYLSTRKADEGERGVELVIYMDSVSCSDLC